PTIKSFHLAKPDGTSIGHYTPGAHIDVVGPTSLTRQYSLCGRPDGDDAYLFAVKREQNGRGGSDALHDLKVGDTLKISAPRNLLKMDESAKHHVLVAGGIGITPMLSLARYMDVRDISFELHYFARSEEEAAFLPLLTERMEDKLFAHLGVPRDVQTQCLESMVDHAPRARTHMYAVQHLLWLRCAPLRAASLLKKLSTLKTSNRQRLMKIKLTPNLRWNSMVRLTRSRRIAASSKCLMKPGATLILLVRKAYAARASWKYSAGFQNIATAS